MAIKFNCGGCDKRLGVADHLAGKRGKCPECGNIFTVPSAGSAPPPPPRATKHTKTDYNIQLDEHSEGDSPDRNVERTEAYKGVCAAASEEVDRISRSSGGRTPAKVPASPAKAAPIKPVLRWRTVGCICAALFSAMILGVVGINTRDSRPTSPSRVEQNGDPAQGVTMENFNKIKTGMTQRQVEDILGGPGTEMSRVEIPGTPTTVMYMWEGDGMSGHLGGNMNVMFQNSRVISKAQFGLK